jgi:hypothetical protein
MARSWRALRGVATVGTAEQVLARLHRGNDATPNIAPSMRPAPAHNSAQRSVHRRENSVQSCPTRPQLCTVDYTNRCTVEAVVEAVASRSAQLAAQCRPALHNSAYTPGLREFADAAVSSA